MMTEVFEVSFASHVMFNEKSALRAAFPSNLTSWQGARSAPLHPRRQGKRRRAAIAVRHAA
jgi:hypothetical protein